MIKLWDKQESINGVSAQDFIKDNPLAEGDILLVTNDTTGIVEQVLNVDVIRNNLKLDITLTPPEVGEAYLKSLEEPKQTEISNKEKIAILEKEKSDLQVALAESIEKQEKDKIELQTAMAEILETISTGGTV